MRFLLLGVAITLLAGCGQKGRCICATTRRRASSRRSPFRQAMPYPRGDETEQN